MAWKDPPQSTGSSTDDTIRALSMRPTPRPRRHWLLAIIVVLACATALFLWFDSLERNPVRAPAAASAATQRNASH